jgi:HAD superfamily hydrolase (TIGR01509 family)
MRVCSYMAVSNIRAIIFDVDGTLVDSNSLHAEAWQKAFRKFGKEVDFHAVHAQIGKGGDQLVPEFLTREEIDKFGEELDHYRGELFKDEYLDRATAFPRVRELFERIKHDGLFIALASSAKSPEVEQHKERLNIKDLVDFATSADDVESSKPDPDIFQTALRGLDGVTPDEAVIVGDSPWDVIAGSKAGMKTIGVLSGGFTREELLGAGAIEIYESVGDLLDRYEESVLGRPHRLAADTQTSGMAVN